MSQHFNLATLTLLAVCVCATTSFKGLARENTEILIKAVEKFSKNLRHKKSYDVHAKSILRSLDTNAAEAAQLAEAKKLSSLLYDAEGKKHDPVKALVDWGPILKKLQGVNRIFGFGCHGHHNKHSKLYEYLCVFDKMKEERSRNF